jgi:hypothetical protein
VLRDCDVTTALELAADCGTALAAIHRPGSILPGSWTSAADDSPSSCPCPPGRRPCSKRWRARPASVWGPSWRTESDLPPSPVPTRSSRSGGKRCWLTATSSRRTCSSGKGG